MFRLRVAAAVAPALAWILFGSASAAVGKEQQVPPMLVFERDGDIYRMTIDGSETVRLTATKAHEGSPSALTRGLSVAYARGSDGGTSVWTMSITGTQQRRLTSHSGDGDPTWSPDGEHVYFTRYFGNRYGEECGSIFRIGPEGRGLRRITRGRASHFHPAVSPDGLHVAFTRSTLCAGGAADLFLAAVDTSSRSSNDFARLGHDYWDPTWSPDGSQVAFSSPGLRGGVFVANRDGSGRRRIVSTRLEARSPSWSPDDNWIAFAGGRGGAKDLHIVRPDGTGLRRITRTDHADEDSPSWLLRS